MGRYKEDHMGKIMEFNMGPEPENDRLKPFWRFAGKMIAGAMALRDLGFTTEEVYEGLEAYFGVDAGRDIDPEDTINFLKETYMELNCKDAEDFIITIRSARGDAAA